MPAEQEGYYKGGRFMKWWRRSSMGETLTGMWRRFVVRRWTNFWSFWLRQSGVERHTPVLIHGSKEWLEVAMDQFTHAKRHLTAGQVQMTNVTVPGPIAYFAHRFDWVWGLGWMKGRTWAANLNKQITDGTVSLDQLDEKSRQRLLTQLWMKKSYPTLKDWLSGGKTKSLSAPYSFQGLYLDGVGFKTDDPETITANLTSLFGDSHGRALAVQIFKEHAVKRLSLNGHWAVSGSVLKGALEDQTYEDYRAPNGDHIERYNSDTGEAWYEPIKDRLTREEYFTLNEMVGLSIAEQKLNRNEALSKEEADLLERDARRPVKMYAIDELTGEQLIKYYNYSLSKGTAGTRDAVDAELYKDNLDRRFLEGKPLDTTEVNKYRVNARKKAQETWKNSIVTELETSYAAGDVKLDKPAIERLANMALDGQFLETEEMPAILRDITTVLRGFRQNYEDELKRIDEDAKLLSNPRKGGFTRLEFDRFQIALQKQQDNQTLNSLESKLVERAEKLRHGLTAEAEGPTQRQETKIPGQGYAMRFEERQPGYDLFKPNPEERALVRNEHGMIVHKFEAELAPGGAAKLLCPLEYKWWPTLQPVYYSKVASWLRVPEVVKQIYHFGHKSGYDVAHVFNIYRQSIKKKMSYLARQGIFDDPDDIATKFALRMGVPFFASSMRVNMHSWFGGGGAPTWSGVIWDDFRRAIDEVPEIIENQLPQYAIEGYNGSTPATVASRFKKRYFMMTTALRLLEQMEKNGKYDENEMKNLERMFFVPESLNELNKRLDELFPSDPEKREGAKQFYLNNVLLGKNFTDVNTGVTRQHMIANLMMVVSQYRHFLKTMTTNIPQLNKMMDTLQQKQFKEIDELA